MRERIGDERLRWLKTLPAVHAGDGLAVVHASPKDLVARADGQCHR
jgi:hypothetical protein